MNCLLIFSLFTVFQCVSTYYCDARSMCRDDQTCCRLGSGWGCCPHPHAVCCDDQAHCCPYGTRCDQHATTCLRSNGEFAGFAQKKEVAMEIKVKSTCPDHKSSCPTGSTCCQTSNGKYGCCPVSNAVCCSDGEHCCPSGFQCMGEYCIKRETMIPQFKKFAATPIQEAEVMTMEDPQEKDVTREDVTREDVTREDLHREDVTREDVTQEEDTEDFELRKAKLIVQYRNSL